jgi:O-acetyl-ADP-ribose deacetylase (regulator of RNase III)
MQIINGDIFSVQFGIVCHQVNCMGKMGTGIAWHIRKRWPRVYNDYMHIYNLGQLQLGRVIITHIKNNELIVASLAGQYNYGRYKRQTDYPALERCFATVLHLQNARQTYLPVYIPYGMGCVNAGGSWEVVSKIIDDIIPHAIVVRKKL